MGTDVQKTVKICRRMAKDAEKMSAPKAEMEQGTGRQTRAGISAEGKADIAGRFS